MEILTAKRWDTMQQIEAEKKSYFNRFMGIRDPRISAMQHAKNLLAAENAERIRLAMYPIDATLKKGDSFSLKTKPFNFSLIGGNESHATLLFSKIISEAATERVLEEYRQGGGMGCTIQYASNGHLILTLTVNDRNGEAMFFVGPKTIALEETKIPKPRRKRKAAGKVELVTPAPVERKKRKYVRKAKPAEEKGQG